jgi:phthalate 4,5-dioxygenase oxygenase subunit
MAGREFRDQGTLPPTAARPDVCLGARGGSFIAPENVDWLDAYQTNLNERQMPQVTRQAAE